MLSDEEKQAIEYLKRHIIPCYGRKGTIEFMLNDIVLNLIEKQSKEIEELKREKEANQQMIQLAETQILGYGQGYKDGLNKEATATAILARERENQIIYEGMKHKINMEWVFKIKAKIEEYKKQIAKMEKDDVGIGFTLGKEWSDLKAKIEFGQSLLEKE